MSKCTLKLSLIATSISLISTTVFAQSAPNIGDALRQAQQPVAPTRPETALPKVGGVQSIEAPMTQLPLGPKIDIQSLNIVGNRVIDTATLSALVADGAGKTLSLAELEALAQRITKYYRSHGYFVARAYIPAQDVTNGSIKIRVVEGNYGEFHLHNESRVRDDIVQGMLDAVKDADIVSLDTLERAMLIINDTPGAQVTRADVMPGQKVGTSDFAVDTVATPAYAGFVAVDNYGSVYTGKNRLSFNADANSPTGRGDRLSLSGLSTDGMGLANARLAYGLPLSATGLRGELALSQTTYQLGEAYQSLQANGSAQAVDVTFTYPLRRIKAQTIEASLNLDYKNLVDKVNSTNTNTPKTSSGVTAGLRLRDEAKVFGFDGLTTASATFTAGDLEINDGTAAALDAAGANTRGNYQKVNLALSRISLLPASFSLTTSLTVQQSMDAKNLDGSEQMAVSGASAVKAYPSGELIGSNATLATFELSHPLPVFGNLQSSVQLFADWGQAQPAKAQTGQGNREISDVGIGWSGNYRTVFVKAQLAHRLESKPASSETTAIDNFLMQVGLTF